MIQDSEFESVYKDNLPRLVNFANYLIGSKSDATEIVNDVFVAVWNNRNSLEFNEKLRPYLYASVKNKCINFLKKRKLETTSMFDNIDATSHQTADSKLLEAEQNKILADILDTLPPKCKQVFIMSRVDGLSYQAIATLLDISKKTVEAQMTKALKIFRKKLQVE